MRKWAYWTQRDRCVMLCTGSCPCIRLGLGLSDVDQNQVGTHVPLDRYIVAGFCGAAQCQSTAVALQPCATDESASCTGTLMLMTSGFKALKAF
jgi:hypothetical protein